MQGVFFAQPRSVLAHLQISPVGLFCFQGHLMEPLKGDAYWQRPNPGGGGGDFLIYDDAFHSIVQCSMLIPGCVSLKYKI